MIHTDGTPTIAQKAADVILEGERLAREIPALTDYPNKPIKIEVEIYPDEYLALERLRDAISVEALPHDDVLVLRLLAAALVRQADDKTRA